jgi:ATP-binding cassette subfamily G (WHITE) protein 2 (SNQ2)
MPHLARSAGSFWTFHFYNYFAFIVMQAFFRFLGLVCANFDSAFRIGAFCTSFPAVQMTSIE